MATAPIIREAPWHAGLRGARANLLPGLALQLFALVLVLAYYRHAPTRDAVNQLADLRGRMGVLFGILSTGLCGGLLPFLYLKAMPATRSRYTWAQGGAITAFWAYKGFEIGLWYRFLAWSVGEGNSPGTVATKMFLDQFVYCPLLAVPLTVLVYDWCEHQFSGAALAAEVRARGWYAQRVLPMLISNLGVWVPAVCIIYALPTALQLPLQNLVLCFFTLLLAHISKRQPAANIT
ncbi:MAG TPA: hypothetical protein VL357_13100 [Rariglobus sp.]|jgi:hypothetical protein|nr:hypothetical protein [Rariglobus sp.]